MGGWRNSKNSSRTTAMLSKIRAKSLSRLAKKKKNTPQRKKNNNNKTKRKTNDEHKLSNPRQSKHARTRALAETLEPVMSSRLASGLDERAFDAVCSVRIRRRENARHAADQQEQKKTTTTTTTTPRTRSVRDLSLVDIVVLVYAFVVVVVFDSVSIDRCAALLGYLYVFFFFLVYSSSSSFFFFFFYFFVDVVFFFDLVVVVVVVVASRVVLGEVSESSRDAASRATLSPHALRRFSVEHSGRRVLRQIARRRAPLLAARDGARSRRPEHGHAALGVLGAGHGSFAGRSIERPRTIDGRAQARFCAKSTPQSAVDGGCEGPGGISVEKPRV